MTARALITVNYCWRIPARRQDERLRLPGQPPQMEMRRVGMPVCMALIFMKGLVALKSFLQTFHKTQPILLFRRISY
jgi:hypothetical protein